MEEIKERIKREICYPTISELTDKALLEEYKACPSVKNKIRKRTEDIHQLLEEIKKNYSPDSETFFQFLENFKQNCIQESLLDLIPAGTKGVIRGNKFNQIVKNYILNLNLDTDRFEISFEKKCEGYHTSEIPDWYILDKLSHKIIIGMNQLDLWGGGQQLNRGSKYLEQNQHNHTSSKLLCVVCNEPKIKTKNSKVYKLFEIGFGRDTLCYLNNLGNIIEKYFEQPLKP